MNIVSRSSSSNTQKSASSGPNGNSHEHCLQARQLGDKSGAAAAKTTAGPGGDCKGPFNNGPGAGCWPTFVNASDITADTEDCCSHHDNHFPV